MSEKHIPRGIEVLVKKAAVDPAFKFLLLKERTDAAKRIGLRLEPAEEMMLNAVAAGQLETIISNARVEPQQRDVFMGYAAAIMLAAITATALGCERRYPEAGIAPEVVPTTTAAQPTTTTMQQIHQPRTPGLDADLPPRAPERRYSAGMRPSSPSPQPLDVYDDRIRSSRNTSSDETEVPPDA
jgi:hypothetical protein